MASARIRDIRVAAPTSAGNQDYTASGETDNPVGAVAIITHATTDATKRAHNRLGIGAYDGTTQAAVGTRERDNQTTSDSGRCRKDGAFIYVTQAISNTIDIEATVTFIAGGVRVNWVNPPGAALLVTIRLWFGPVSFKVGSLSSNGTTPNTTDITWTGGFGPDQLMYFGNGLTFSSGGTTGNDHRIGIGLADIAQDGTVVEACKFITTDDALGSLPLPNGGGVCSRAHSFWQIRSFGVPTPSIENRGAIKTVQKLSNGFQIAQAAASVVVNCLYVAIKYDGGNEHSLEFSETPTAAAPTTQNISTGYRPLAAFGFTAGAQVSELQTLTSSDPFCLFVLNQWNNDTGTAEEFTNEVIGDDNQNPTVADSYTSAKAVDFRFKASASLEADLGTIDATSFDLDWTNTLSIARVRADLVVGDSTRLYPDAVDVPLAVPAVERLIDVTPDPVAVALAVPAVARRIDLTPDPVELAIGTPAVERLIDVTPDPVAVALAVPAVARRIDLTPDPVGVDLVIPAPAVLSEIRPDPVVVQLGLPAVERTVQLTPDPLAVQLVPLAVSRRIDLTPDPVAVALGIPAHARLVTLCPDPVEVQLGLPAVERTIQLTPDPVVVQLLLLVPDLMRVTARLDLIARVARELPVQAELVTRGDLLAAVVRELELAGEVTLARELRAVVAREVEPD